MKKIMTALAVSVLASTAFADAPVNSGTVAGAVSLTGELSQSTCKLMSDSTSINVDLKKYPSEGLREANSVSARVRPFAIKLTACPATYKSQEGDVFSNVSIKFDESATITEDGTLSNTATGKLAASNIQAQILNAAEQVVNLKTGDNATEVALADSASGDVTLQFKARLASKEGNAVAGQFTTNVPFQITYK